MKGKAQIAWISAFVAVAIVLVWVSPRPSANTPSRTETADRSDTLGAWVACKTFVEKRLKSPASAEWPPSYPKHTQALGGNRYRVRVYVDSQNAFGAVLRTQVDCTVTVEGSSWELNNLALE